MLVIISIKGHGIRFQLHGSWQKSLLDTFRCNLTRSLIWLSSQRVLVPCSGLGQGHPRGRRGHCRVPFGAADFQPTHPPTSLPPASPQEGRGIPIFRGGSGRRVWAWEEPGQWGWGEARGVSWHRGRGLSLQAFRAADARSWRAGSWQSPEHSARSLRAPWCGLHPRVPAVQQPNSRPCISTGQGR